MNDSDDETLRYALGAVAGVVALVLAGVIALAASTSMNRTAPAATQLASAAASAADAADASAGKLYFESGSAALPADATEVLNRIAETARANTGASVLISGFHDASGDPAANEELAKNRAQAVRHALQANGVPEAQLVMDKPALTEAAGDPKQARRVEVRVQ